MSNRNYVLYKKLGQNRMIVVLVLIGAVLLTWTTSNVNRSSYIQKEREGFEKAEAAAESAIEDISEKLSVPLYDDRAHFCMLDTVGKDPEEKLFCDTLFTVYYDLGPEDAEDTVQFVKRVIEQTYSTALITSEYDFDLPAVRLRVGSHKIEQFNGLNCAIGMRYPERGPSNSYLPNRTFGHEHVLSVSVHCDKHVRERVYPD